METIIQQSLPEAHIENYTPYSMHLIIGRAFPSIEDGLKTVSRRIMYNMGTDDNKFHKGAHYVGGILSRLHPHGNASLYESIVILSQSFFHLNSLVKARGNNGSILDPFSYAAERYLELKISNLANEVYFKEFNSKTNPMMLNYDKSGFEPKTLPSIFPMILANSNDGIAVGYAVSLPSHNLKDIANTTIFKLNNPEAKTKELMKYLKGPDYSTGGYVLNQADLVKIYEEGSGSIILRGNITTNKVNSKDCLIINEIPNTVTLGKILEELVNLCKPDKKGNNGLFQDLIYDIKDKSDETKLEVVIIPKKNVDLEILKNLIYQHTSMQSIQKYNANVLLNYTLQKNVSLEFILNEWIKFRISTIRKDLSYELSIINEKLTINKALIKAHNNIDAIIKLIRSSKGGKDVIKNELINNYNFADKEAEYIINQELFKIANIQINSLNEDNQKLNKRYQEIIKVLPNENEIKKIIISQLNFIVEKYSVERKTKLINLESKIDTKDLIEEKELFIAITTDKFIYSKEISELKTGTKRNKGQNFAEIKKGKIIENSFIINNKTKLMCLSKKGIAYILDGYKLNVNNIHINNLIGNLPSDDFIISFLTIDNINEGYLLTVNNKSFFKKTNITEYFSSNRTNGIIALKLDDDEELIEAAYVPNDDYTILLGTDKGYVSKFSLNNIVEAGRVAKGRPLIRFKEQNENVVSLNIVNNIELDKSFLLLLTKNGIGKLTLINELLDKKTEKGMSSAFKAITLKKDDYLLKNKIVIENDIIIVNTNLGKTIKIEANNVNSYSRNAKGDKLITLNDNDYVNSLNIIQE